MIWALFCLAFVLVIGIGILAIFFIPKVISFLLEPKSGSMKPKSEESPEVSSSREPKSNKVRVKTDSPTAYSSKKSSKEKEGLLSRLNLVSGKKKCNECGTELEYREEYQSHYCPKCRTYK